MSLIDLVKQQLGNDGLNQISEHLGADQSTTENAVTAAVPLMLGSMAQQAGQPGGAAALQQEVSSHQGLFGGLQNMLSGSSGTPTGPGGLLSRLLGARHDTVHDGVQQASGLDSDKTKKLMLILGPIVMAALAHHQREQRVQPGQLGSILQQEAQTARLQAQAQSPQMGGLLGALLGRM
jgi:hypothetical protein